MTQNLKALTKTQLKGVGTEHGIVLADSMTKAQMIAELIQQAPVADANDTTETSTNGFVTKIIDRMPQGKQDLLDAVATVDAKLAERGAYDETDVTVLNTWVRTEIMPLFIGHALSFGPNRANGTYQISISGNSTNIQWVFKS